jgi:hypothetical protein
MESNWCLSSEKSKRIFVPPNDNQARHPQLKIARWTRLFRCLRLRRRCISTFTGLALGTPDDFVRLVWDSDFSGNVRRTDGLIVVRKQRTDFTGNQLLVSVTTYPVSGMGILVADKVKQDSVVLLQAPWLPTPQFQSPTFRIPPPLTHSVSVLTISWLGPSVPQSRLQLATVRQPNAAWLAVAN